MKNKVNINSISYNAYDEMAEYYYKFVDTKPYNAMYERPALLSLLPNVENKTVLDAGCAAGWYTKWLLDKGSNPIAIDFNKNMVDFTRLRTQSKCQVVQADLNEPLDFIPDNSIDIILSSLTLHYIKNWSFVFDQFYKKLRNGGLLVFSTHHPFMDFHLFDEIKNYFETTILHDTWTTDKGKVEVDFYRRPLQDIINPLIQNGFRIQEILEPLPTNEFKKHSPKTYQRLSNNPQFLFVKAKKICPKE